MKLNHLHKQEYFSSETQAVGVLHNTSHKSYGAHDHDFFEIVLITSGQAAHRSAEGEEVLRACDVLVIRPGVWHEYLEQSNFSVYNCMFSRELFNHELSWILNDPVLYPIFFGGIPSQRLFLTHLPPQAFFNCRKCMKELLKVESASSFSRLQQVGLLLQIMGIIAQTRSTSALNISTIGEKLHSSVIRAMHLLESQIDRSWTLGDLASELNIHASYLSRLFKKGTGMPPVTYLAHCRDRRSADLLLATKLSIAEIAQKVGWDDPNYFARRFTKNFGTPPSQYRANFMKQYK